MNACHQRMLSFNSDFLSQKEEHTSFECIYSVRLVLCQQLFIKVPSPLPFARFDRTKCFRYLSECVSVLCFLFFHLFVHSFIPFPVVLQLWVRDTHTNTNLQLYANETILKFSTYLKVWNIFGARISLYGGRTCSAWDVRWCIQMKWKLVYDYVFSNFCRSAYNVLARFITIPSIRTPRSFFSSSRFLHSFFQRNCVGSIISFSVAFDCSVPVIIAWMQTNEIIVSQIYDYRHFIVVKVLSCRIHYITWREREKNMRLSSCLHVCYKRNAYFQLNQNHMKVAGVWDVHLYH